MPSLREPVLAQRQLPDRALASPKRLRVIDYWRGICLFLVFLNHLPDNWVRGFSLQAFGFSDAAAIFFFLSGYVCYLAFDSIVRKQGWAACVQRALKRAVLLYGAHILMVAAATLVITVYHLTRPAGDPLLPFDRANESRIAEQPWTEIGRAFVFRQTMYMCQVLPLYAVFVALTPAVLAAVRRQPWVTWLASATLWLAVRASVTLGLDLGLHHTGWWFNPFGWQFLFVSGIVLSRLRVTGFDWGRLRWPFVAAGVATALAIALVDQRTLGWTAWFQPMFNNKRFCDFTYVAHFALLLILVRHFIPDDRRLARLPAVSHFETVGKHSLSVWVGSSILVFLLTFLARLVAWPGWIEDTVQIALGTAVFAAFAMWLHAAARKAAVHARTQTV